MSNPKIHRQLHVASLNNIPFYNVESPGPIKQKRSTCRAKSPTERRTGSADRMFSLRQNKVKERLYYDHMDAKT